MPNRGIKPIPIKIPSLPSPNSNTVIQKSTQGNIKMHFLESITQGGDPTQDLLDKNNCTDFSGIMTPDEIFSTHRNSALQNLTRHSKFTTTNTRLELMPEISRVSKLSSNSNEPDEKPTITESISHEPETFRLNPN